MNEHKKRELASGHNKCSLEVLLSYSVRYDLFVADGENVLASLAKKSFGYDELRKMLALFQNFGKE